MDLAVWSTQGHSQNCPQDSLGICLVIALSNFNNIIKWNVQVLFCSPPLWLSLLTRIYLFFSELFWFLLVGLPRPHLPLYLSLGFMK